MLFRLSKKSTFRSGDILQTERQVFCGFFGTSQRHLFSLLSPMEIRLICLFSRCSDTRVRNAMYVETRRRPTTILCV